MIRADRNHPLVPSFSVKLNDTVLGKDVAAWIMDAVVEDELDVPGMFTLHLASKEDEHGTAPWTDAEQFALGTAVTVSFGYGDRVEPLIAGEVTALEPSFHLGGAPTLIVRGYDKRHRLNTVRRTRSFVDQKDSDIADKICSDAGVRAVATDSDVTHPYVLQAAQTDLDFLLERARRIQYELAMDDGTLLFRPVANEVAETLTMTLRDDLLEFRPRMSVVPLTQLQVFAWDPKEKQAFAAVKGDDAGQTGSNSKKMGGEKTAAQQASEFFGDSVETEAFMPVGSQAEADQIAAAHFSASGLNYIRGEGACYGCTGVRAGSVIRIAQIGERFSGQYYVTSAVHSYTRRGGYTTRFRVRRNAS